MGGIMKHIRVFASIIPRIIFFIFIITCILPGCGKSSGPGLNDILLLLGQGGSADRGGSAFIDAAEGGVVRLNDEVSLFIPPDSIYADTEITIQRVTDLPAGETDGLSAFGQAYRFLPKGVEFSLSNPAVLELSYDSAELERRGLTPETMQICYYDETCGSYVPVNCQVDTVRKKIIAYIEHFTVYLPMAQAMAATNNRPTVGLQAPVPNPIRAGAPIYVRATVTDYDGSVAGVRLEYRKLQPAPGAWQTARMVRESNAQATLNTYGYVIPASFLTAADLGTGNDIEYRVTATDNLGASRTSAIRRYDVTRTYQPGSLTFNPAVLDIAAGFERYFVLRGVDDTAATFNVVPETFSLSRGSGLLTNRFAQGLLFRAQTQTVIGFPEQLAAGFDSESVIASINVHAGEIDSIEILDTNGLPIVGSVVLTEGAVYSFDVVGHDGYGNMIPIIPAWTADPAIGIITAGGVLDTTGFTGSGLVGASLLYASDTRNVIVQSHEKEITSFSINGVPGVISFPFITVTLPWGTDVTSLAASFATTGQSVTVGGSVQQSGVTANDYTDPVIFRVTAGDGSSQDYTVRVRMLRPFKDITSFSINGIAGRFTGTSILLRLPNAADLASLTAVFTTTGESVTVGGTVQDSGVTINDFTSPVIYTVTAEDGTSQTYTVTVEHLATDRWIGKNAPWPADTGVWPSISSSSDGLRLAVAKNAGYIYTSVDGGASWTESTGAGSRGWMFVASSADGTRLAAVDYGGYIYTSADGGATWNERTSAGRHNWYSLASSADGMRLAAGGASSYIYTSADGGITWTERTGSGNNVWYSITSSADGTRLAASNGTFLVTSSDGGANWVKGTFAGGFYCVSSSPDGTRLAAVGTGSESYILTSIDAGVTWTIRTSAGRRNWSSIAISADGLSLAATVGNGGYIYTSIDGGVTWTERSGAGSRYWYSITSSSDGARLSAAAGSGYIYTSTDGGVTWTERTGAGGIFARISTTSSADGLRLAAGIYGGYIYTSSDFGTSWTKRTNAGLRNWYSIDSSADGSRIVAAVVSGYIYTSVDGGVSWTERTSAGNRGWESVASSADGLRLAACDGYGYIYTSPDGGATWTERTSAGNRGWKSIAVSVDGSKIFVVKSGGYIYTSDNFGVSWTERTGSGSRFWSSISSSADGLNLAATVWRGDVYGGYIYTSADGGATWTERTGAGNRSWSSIALSSDGINLAAVVNGGYIYASTDGGANWIEMTSAGSHRWSSITASSDFYRMAAFILDNMNVYVFE